MPKRWAELEYQAGSEHPEDRVDAVIKAHARVEKYLKPDDSYNPYGNYGNYYGYFERRNEWSPEIRWAVLSVRNKVVHQEYDPTIEEAQEAVRRFFELWRENQDCTNDPDPDKVEDLEEIAVLYEKRDIAIESDRTELNEMEQSACSADPTERTTAVMDAYEWVESFIKKWHKGGVISNPEENFETALNQAYAILPCEMQCDEATRWAYLLAQYIQKTGYQPSIAETYRATHVFREIWDILNKSDYLPDDGISLLYRSNFESNHTDIKPKSINEIARDLNVNPDIIVNLAQQIGLYGGDYRDRSWKIQTDHVLIIYRTFQIGLFT